MVPTQISCEFFPPPLGFFAAGFFCPPSNRISVFCKRLLSSVRFRFFVRFHFQCFNGLLFSNSIISGISLNYFSCLLIPPNWPLLRVFVHVVKHMRFETVPRFLSYRSCGSPA